MGSALGRILGRSSTASSASTVASVRRPKEPTTGPEPSAVDPSLHQPDTQLLDKLRDVYVESTTNVITQENPYGSERITSTSKLPQDRTSYDEDTFHHGTNSSEGYLTAQQVLEIFDKRGANESEWTEQKIATDYKISQEDAVNLVKYFGSYHVMGTLEKRKPDMKLHPLHR